MFNCLTGKLTFGGPFSRNITILTECYPDCKARLPSLTQLSTGTDILCSIEMTIKLGGGEAEQNVSEKYRHFVEEVRGINGVILTPIIYKSVNRATGLCHFKQSGRILQKYLCCRPQGI